jgi:hypothetical protein
MRISISKQKKKCCYSLTINFQNLKMRKIDKAPIPYTCSSIDQAIELIENVEMNNYDRLLIIDLLEELREDNAKLRECINEILDI